jgi:hypothetical protein
VNIARASLAVAFDLQRGGGGVGSSAVSAG